MASRLYRHALESILAFASLSDLAHAAAVSQAWGDAVCSMRPCGLTIRLSQRFNISSQLHLSRHVSSASGVFTVQMLHRLCDIPSLSTLRGQLDCGVCPWPPASDIPFPPSLTSADLGLFCGSANLVFAAVSVLPRLAALRFEHPFCAEQIVLDPLTALSTLHTLELHFPTQLDMIPTSAHVAAIRAIPHLTCLRMVRIADATLISLLSLPCPLKLQEIGYVELVSAAALDSLLSQSTSLTSLAIRDVPSTIGLPAAQPHRDSAEHFRRALSELHQLQTLSLRGVANATSVFDAIVRHRPQLRTLIISPNELNPRQRIDKSVSFGSTEPLCKLLSALPQLRVVARDVTRAQFDELTSNAQLRSLGDRFTVEAPVV